MVGWLVVRLVALDLPGGSAARGCVCKAGSLARPGAAPGRTAVSLSSTTWAQLVCQSEPMLTIEDQLPSISRADVVNFMLAININSAL